MSSTEIASKLEYLLNLKSTLRDRKEALVNGETWVFFFDEGGNYYMAIRKAHVTPKELTSPKKMR